MTGLPEYLDHNIASLDPQLDNLAWVQNLLKIKRETPEPTQDKMKGPSPWEACALRATMHAVWLPSTSYQESQVLRSVDLHNMAAGSLRLWNKWQRIPGHRKFPKQNYISMRMNSWPSSFSSTAPLSATGTLCPPLSSSGISFNKRFVRRYKILSVLPEYTPQKAASSHTSLLCRAAASSSSVSSNSKSSNPLSVCFR